MSQFISRKQPPDLVILDSILPKVDGFQLITLIRNQPSWKKTPIVMLTASFSENSAVRAFSLGADDYITKPFRPSELLARLKRLLPED
jgi:DNA-binding response OmpR family regulator